MSIVKIRSMFEKKGCQYVTFGVMALVAVGLIYSGSCFGMFGPGGAGVGPEGENPVIVDVGGEPVTYAVAQQIESMSRQSQPSNGDPRVEFNIKLGALEVAMQQAATVSIAKKKGLKVSTDSASRMFNADFDRQLEAERLQLVQEGKLKDGASQQEFLAAFKTKTGGKSPDELKKTGLASFLEALKDPAQAQDIERRVLAALVREAYEKEHNPTEADLKKSYDAFNVKVLPFDDPKMSSEQKAEAAKKAVAEIKSGLSFDDAIKKYAKGRPNAPMPFGRQYVETQEELKPLLDLKPGGLSDPIEAGGNVSVYQLVDIKSNLPADFEKNKARMMEAFKGQKAMQAQNKDIDNVLKGSTQWKDPVYKLAYDVFIELREGFQAGPQKMADNLMALAKELQDAEPKTGAAIQIKSFARFVAFEQAFASMKPEQQKELRKDRALNIEDVLQNTESVSLRLDAYDNYLAIPKYEEAGQALVDAATANVGTEPQNIFNNGEIERRIREAEKAAKVNKEYLEKAKQAVARWGRERLEAEAQRKEDEKAKSSVDDELKKLEETPQKSDPGKSPEGSKK